MADIRENVTGVIPSVKMLDMQLSNFGLTLKYVKPEEIEKLVLRLDIGEFLVEGQLILIKSIVGGATGIPAIVTKVTHVKGDHFTYTVLILAGVGASASMPDLTLNIDLNTPTFPMVIDVTNVADALAIILADKLGNVTSRDLLVKYDIDGIYTLDSANKQFNIHM